MADPKTKAPAKKTTVIPATKKSAKKKAEAPPPPPKKSAAQVLREALAAKKAAGPSDGRPLRPDHGGGHVRKDAERLAGKSRKVH